MSFKLEVMAPMDVYGDDLVLYPDHDGSLKKLHM